MCNTNHRKLLRDYGKKVKRTLVQALRLCTGSTAHRGRRCIALLFLDHGTRRGEGSASRPGRSLPPGKDAVPIVQEAEWAPGPVWTGGENLAPTGIRFPNRAARSQSLYRLRHPPTHFYGVSAFVTNVLVYSFQESSMCHIIFLTLHYITLHYITYIMLR